MLRCLRYSGMIIIVMIAQTAGHALTVSGIVLDKDTGNPIPDAEVRIEKTPFHTSSRDGGYFFMDHIPEGKYSFRADVVGYESQVLTKIEIFKDATLTFHLAPNPIQMDPVLVIGTRSEHRQSRVTVASKVLTAEWIGLQNGDNAAEVVENTGGLFVKDGGGFAGLKTLSIRGSGDSQVLVLLDGQRLNSAQDGSVDISDIPTEILERIEIVRGGHSALVGTDAVGGAVHLVTRNALPAKGFLYGVQSTIGSFGTKVFGTYGTQQIGPMDFYFSYHHAKSDGDFTYTSPLDNTKKSRADNDYSGNHLFFKARYNLSYGGKLQFIGHWNRSDRGSADPVTSTFPSTNARRKENLNLYGLLFEHQLLKRIQIQAQTYIQKHNNTFHSIYENDRHDNLAFGLDLVSRWILSPDVLFTAGTELRSDGLKSTKFKHQERNTQSLFVQTEIDHPLNLMGLDMRWKWVPALRWDHYQQRKIQNCPKIGLLINPFRSVDLAIKGNMGRSFRLPTFNDLYWPEIVWPGMGGVRGNPDLVPETGLNTDVGFLLRSGQSRLFSLELTLFKNRINDLILWESDANWVYSPRNVGKADITGIENEWSLSLPEERAYMKVAPTWMVSKDLTAAGLNQKLVYRPEFKMDVQAGVKIAGFRINACYQHVGKRYVLPDNSKSLSRYELIGGNIQTSFVLSGIKISSKLQANNLADKNVTIVEGYPIPGRELRFSCGFDW